MSDMTESDRRTLAWNPPLCGSYIACPNALKPKNKERIVRKTIVIDQNGNIIRQIDRDMRGLRALLIEYGMAMQDA